ncbi:MAG: amino acid adenylation domain-containing protein [Steroidobacteraceae bacterium]
MTDSPDFTQVPTLVHHLRNQARSAAQQVVFRFVDDHGEYAQLCYDSLDQQARRLAARLQALGMTGQRAVLMHPPGPEYVLALLGCFYAGVVAVPAYPPRFNRPMERLRDLVVDADARLALTTQTALQRIQKQASTDVALSGLSWLATDDLPADCSADSWTQPSLDADSIALLQYTSGSTSAPKGVVITHGCFRNNVQSMAQALNVTADDRLVTWLPPYHDMGLVGGLLAPLFVGMEAVVLSPVSFMQRPLRWLSAIAEYRATISGGPNFGYELCTRRITQVQCEQLDLSHWRVAFCGAERVRAGTLQQFANHFATSGFKPEAFAPCYGMAEATLGVSFSTEGLRYADAESHQPISVTSSSNVAQQISVSCGRVIPGVQLRVVDHQTLQVVPEGAVGELWIQSNAMAKGYWRKPEQTTETFNVALSGESGEWLRTGDLGFMQQGELHVLGRLKDLIIIRGVNVYPEDIEALVERVHDDLRPAGAVAFSIERDNEEQLVVVQEINPGVKDLDAVAISAQMQRVIAEAMQLAVQHVVLVEPGGVPRTSSGKVQRRRCRELYLAGQLPVIHDSKAAKNPLVAATPELVNQVAHLMADLLQVEALAPDDDFFWLGGHSLLATQLASRVRNVFDIDLPLSVIFSASTPQRLAAEIAGNNTRFMRTAIQPIPRTGRLPMTFSQERMWLLHQMDPQGTAYNVGGASLISGPLNVAALSRAFTEVVATHEILRTRYRTIHGEADVQVMPAQPVEVNAEDLRDVASPMDVAMQRATQLTRQPFDIANESLLRIALYRTGENQHVLAACIHHLVTDAWSMGIMVRDLFACYDALLAGQQPALVSPAISYIDYAHWQRRFLSDRQLDTQLDYWKQQLQGAEAIELPTDMMRRQQRSSAGGLEPLPLSGELMESIGELAKMHGATPFMVMLAAFEVLLFRWTSRTDLVVGVPVANRNWQESEALMGTLVNTLPVRLRFDGQMSFTQLLGLVRQQALDAYNHQDLPFEKLIAELRLERKPGMSPLVSVMFDYQNTPIPGRNSGTTTMKPLFLSRGSSQFDLSLLIMDTEFGRVAGVEYSSELFTAKTIQRMLGHYLTLLQTVLIDPNTRVDQLPLLTDGERQILLQQSQRTCRANVAITPLIERIDTQCKISAQRLAVQDARVALTYAELQQRVLHTSALLTAQGVVAGQRVAVCMERGVDLVVALLAVLRCGAAYVPLDPNHPRDRLGYVIEDAQPALLLTQSHVAGMREMAGELRLVCIDQLSAAEAPAMSAPAQCDESLAAYVIYTSGSTGRPKGVEVSRRALANFIQSMQHTPGITADDRLLSVTTVAFDIFGLELYLPLAAGAALYVVSTEVTTDGDRLQALMRDWQTSFMQATPATWKMLLETGWRGDSRLKVLCGGEAFPRELAQRLQQCAGSVWNMYGPTETTIWSTVQRVVSSDEPLVPIGDPIDETSIYILDQHRQLVPQGVAGEIWIGGLGVANGYFHRAELTAEKFCVDPFMAADKPQHARMYRTGDAGRWRANGVLDHLGRLDDQIKIRGFRIEPGEIEQILKEHAGVQDAVVLAREIRPGDMRLIAYYVPVDTQYSVSGLPTAELLEPLRRRLPAYMVPTAFVPMALFPTTPNNKIDRRALPTPSLDVAASDSEYVAPRDELEQSLVAMWQDLLQVARVGIRDNFFLLGGHSLLAVRLFARVNTQFAVNLQMAMLFERPTIEYLAEAIREARNRLSAMGSATGSEAGAQTAARTDVQFEHLVPIHRGGRKPPLFCVHGAGGNVLNLWALAKSLGTDQPFFGIQARGVDGIASPMTDVYQMTETYLREIRQVQPTGPYHLSGYCAGGWVALEMARRLRAEGETVALLILLDSYYPRSQPAAAPLRHFIDGVRTHPWQYLSEQVPTAIHRYAVEASSQLRITLSQWLGRAVPLELRDFWLTHAMARAEAHYTPKRYGGDVVLVRAADADAQLAWLGENMGWDHTLAGAITHITVSGNHHTLAEEPHVGVLAAHLQAELLARSQEFGIALRTGMMLAGKPESFR